MPRCPLICLLVLLLGLSAARSARADDWSLPHVRPMSDGLRQLVLDGLARSPLFRALVERLGRSDVVVYLQAAALPRELHGQLTFLSAAGGFRYVVVRLRTARVPTRLLIAALAHELQHAIEVAEHAEIVDQASMARVYTRLGVQRASSSAAVTAFDTSAAIAAGSRVWLELAPTASAD